jgi:hypothetical protein
MQLCACLPTSYNFVFRKPQCCLLEGIHWVRASYMLHSSAAAAAAVKGVYACCVQATLKLILAAAVCAQTSAAAPWPVALRV